MGTQVTTFGRTVVELVNGTTEVTPNALFYAARDFIKICRRRIETFACEAAARTVLISNPSTQVFVTKARGADAFHFSIAKS